MIRLLREDKTELNSPIDSNLVNVTSASSGDQVTEQPFEKVKKKKKKRKNKKTQDKQTISSASVPAKKCSKYQTSSRNDVTTVILSDSMVKMEKIKQLEVK